MILRQLATCATLVLLPTLATAQSDNCGSATAIAGEGTWSYDSSGANSDGPSPCALLGADVWYLWTANATDTFTLTTCAGTSYDSALAVYPSGCPAGASIACNDDSSCGLQSTLSFAAVSGVQYLFQVGGYSGNSGNGQLEVSQGGVNPGGDCIAPATGPDVIIGTLNGIEDYGSVGGIAGYSIGTTSCNIGTSNLNWISSTNDHPVIGQNIYRLKDGRFEQIGQSWLKHGFFALQGDVCCTCTGTGSGSALGVGCSDPYGAGLNGSQGGLGPRSEVNPYTGVFLYPFTHGDQGSSGDAAYKRIQVANTDLDPSLNPGAQYFGSAQYVAKDDAQAGNGENNAAWIDINVGSFSGGNWNLSLSGGTNRQEPAIRAWLDSDPTVMLSDIHAPGEGLFIVGSNAYDNGDGTWDYEYAVFNLNSDIACGSFEVPTQAGTTVSNVGFHDADCHSGEPYSNTDWPGNVGGSDVSWNTTPFVFNPNGNAIRWGTMYNFRFTADAAPVTGSVDVGMYKTGGSVAAAAKVPGTSTGSPLSILCDPNNNHFQGDYVKLDSSSFGSGTGSGLHLEAIDGPTTQFGFFLIGGGGGGSIVQSNGILCLTSPIARYNGNVATNQGLPQLDSIGQFDVSGVFQNLSGNSLVGSGFDVPSELPYLPSGQSILAGQTHYFQLWYRDLPAGTANWSNVLGASF
tara:strand:- start:964 stop:3018 length:2055 start_codon:yes stop_codon:yes gene_type:complete